MMDAITIGIAIMALVLMQIFLAARGKHFSISLKSKYSPYPPQSPVPSLALGCRACLLLVPLSLRGSAAVHE